MDIKISPSYLNGTINIPSSKSISHRALICAALAEGKSVIQNILDCEDITATAAALDAFGARIKLSNNAEVIGYTKASGDVINVDCGESGSTLRFLVPVAAALGLHCFFIGSGKLPQRPLTPYFTELKKHDIMFLSEKMPYEMVGKLTAGEYHIAGNISSQFISGLLFALPLVNGDSKIIVTTPLESKPYVDLTIKCLNSFGVEISEVADGYFIKGNQHYKSADYIVEADMSQAAFFAVADCLGSKISMSNLNLQSVQGDKEIIRICEKFKIDSQKKFEIDAADIPDIVPVLSVLLCFGDDVSYIRNCARLRIKESDRLAVIAEELNKIGGKIEIVGDDLKISPIDNFIGNVCSSHNDHRIAMSLAIASTRCKGDLTITGAECVAKSYPTFWNDFTMLGGHYHVVNN